MTLRTILGTAAAVLFLTHPASAQLQQGEPRPEVQVLADSTFAVRLAVEDLADMIRRGELGIRYEKDAALATPVRNLSAAAGRRPRRGANFTPAWDFGLEVVDVQPAGPGQMVVRARAALATRDARPANVVLRFERDAGVWMLKSHEGLVAALTRFATQISRGGA